jgi:hypothetical protein
MSFFALTFDFLSFKPKTWIEGNQLISRTSFLGQLLRLFYYSKRIVVDKRQKIVSIQKRFFWIFNTEQIIEFDEIKRIDYSYSERMTSWSFVLGPTDQLEFYTVSLMLGSRMDENKIKLWTFWGEGTVMTGFTGVLAGDGVFDLSGNKERRSRDYVSLLK